MKEVMERLLSGQQENHILPFLWMHGEEEGVLREYMRAIYNAGISAVCVESRPHPDFVGELWWRDMDVILDQARSLGMQVWILDDRHFPTGYAAGTMREAEAELCRQCLCYRSLPCVKSGEEMVVEMHG